MLTFIKIITEMSRPETIFLFTKREEMIVNKKEFGLQNLFF